MSSQRVLVAPHWSAAYSQISSTQALWLKEFRAAHWDKFIAAGFPHKRQENWRYTDLSALEKKQFTLSAGPAISEHELLAPQDTFEFTRHRLVFIDGHFCSALSHIHALPTGAILMSLHEACSQYPESVRTHLQQGVASTTESLFDLGNAFLLDGVFLSLDKGVVLDLPLHILSFTTAAESVHTLKHLILADVSSQAVIFEEHRALTAAAYYSHVMTQCHLQAQARVKRIQCLQNHTEGYVFSHAMVLQKRDSHFEQTTVMLGAKTVREDTHVILNEPGASCALYGFYCGDAQQHLDHHLLIDHNTEQSSSQVNYRGVLAEKASGVFNGKIRVHPHAQKTKAQLNNQTVLLSPKAEMNTKPELEIYADDVMCAHGATVGALDEDALFYLRARGVSEVEAKKMLLLGFAEASLAHIIIPEVADYVRALIAEKMGVHNASAL